MKKITLLPLLVLILSLSSCQVIGGIFKAGVGTGIVLVIVVIAVIIFILSKVMGGGKQ